MDERKDQTSESYDLKYLEQQVYNLGRLVEINGIINSTLDMAKLLTLIMEIIKDIMNTEASTLLLYEEENQELVFKVALGEAGRELQEKYRVRVGQGVAGWVAEHRAAVYINEVYGDSRFDPNFDKKTGFTTRAILCAPLLFKGKLLGVIQAINPLTRKGFSEDDVALFNSFADQCVLAVQNAIFFKNALEEERIKNELKSAHAIQQSLLPAISEKHNAVSVAARTISAREVGGEFYDIYTYEDASLGIALGDLHMKGIPGAIYASMMIGAVKALSQHKRNNPSVLLRMVYETMTHVTGDRTGLSLFYGVITPDRALHFANTGIAYPILVRDGVARYLRFSGNFRDSVPKNVRLVLRGGDCFVILTDGIINVKNRRGQLLGLKRVMKRLETAEKNPDEILRSLLLLMDEFAEGLERREDVSIIAFTLDRP